YRSRSSSRLVRLVGDVSLCRAPRRRQPRCALMSLQRRCLVQEERRQIEWRSSEGGQAERAGTAGESKKGASLRRHGGEKPKAAAINHVTEAGFRAKAKHHPGLTKRIDISFGMDPAKLGPVLAEAEVLVASGGVDISGVSTQAPKLKWIQSTSAGVEKLIRYVPKGVALTNASGLHAPKGGEYAMTALLMLNHDVPHFVTSQRAGKWLQSHATPIAGKTLVIVGVGALGGAAARLAKGFGMRILGVSRSG